MISHVTLGTSDLLRASHFYSEILSPMAAEEIYRSDTVIFWQFNGSPTKLAITIPYDRQPASFGNGTMLALDVGGIEKVDEIFSLALKLGGISEGDPGFRNLDSFYGAYFRDLDGNKIAIFTRQNTG
ncbi:glyoxalase [Microbulbifer sp. A4B17]|uniref:VOC family protein n=1 Tax=Microbulbifer sp. A4B17 TaxID=359370 RepID=UPI000D52BDB2|nr:VOC family protein [Microbulbifer sp. A4B17]AWF80910.1 glyoxalase [Microbulbifer sp. A4B17]